MANNYNDNFCIYDRLPCACRDYYDVQHDCWLANHFIHDNLPIYRYELMLKCWEADCDERFSFKVITEKLSVTTREKNWQSVAMKLFSRYFSNYVYLNYITITL